MSLIVNYFGATWCGPCKKAKPVIQSKEESLKVAGHEVVYWDIDDDEAEDMVERHDVQAVPTIIITKGGETVGTFKGWNDSSEAQFDKVISENSDSSPSQIIQ